MARPFSDRKGKIPAQVSQGKTRMGPYCQCLTEICLKKHVTSKKSSPKQNCLHVGYTQSHAVSVRDNIQCVCKRFGSGSAVFLSLRQYF